MEKKHQTTVGDCHGPVIDRRESWTVNVATCGDEWSSYEFFLLEHHGGL